MENTKTNTITTNKEEKVMKHFSKKIDLRSRKNMVEFLTSHFRYSTMNSWNCSTSYAHNVKIYNLGLTSEQKDKVFEMIDTNEFYEEIQYLIDDFARAHDYKYQVGFNGRSDGYLVLYEGGQEDTKYKSKCMKCGQLNYKTIEETGNCKCGKCGNDARVNLIYPIIRTFTYPGHDIDMNEDFEEWDINSIRDRVKLVQDFDQLCDDILAEVIYLCDNATVEEEIEYIPQKKKVLVVKEI